MAQGPEFKSQYQQKKRDQIKTQVWEQAQSYTNKNVVF
jgi:hypothetical protein